MTTAALPSHAFAIEKTNALLSYEQTIPLIAFVQL